MFSISGRRVGFGSCFQLVDDMLDLVHVFSWWTTCWIWFLFSVGGRRVGGRRVGFGSCFQLVDDLLDLVLVFSWWTTCWIRFVFSVGGRHVGFGSCFQLVDDMLDLVRVFSWWTTCWIWFVFSVGGRRVGFGSCFQLVDDMLDFLSSDEVSGKPTNADLRLGLATAPVLFAALQVGQWCPRHATSRPGAVFVRACTSAPC